MALVPVENIGSIGIVKDTPDYKLPPEAWSDGANMRFVDGKAQKILGQDTTLGTPSIAPHWLLPWRTATEERWVYAGVSDVYYVTGTTHTSITRYTTTPGDNDYTAGSRPVWTGGNLHGVPILNHNNRTDYPQQWDSALARLKDLDNWPANTYAEIIRPFKNVLVALHVKESGTEFPYVLRWSQPADPGAVPSSWDYTDPTKLAGRKTIAQSGGFLVDCLPMGPRNIIYKQDAIWGMSLAGSQFVFAFDPLSTEAGALTKNCIQALKGQHIVVAQNDIITFDGITPRSILTKRMRSWFFNLLHETYWDRTTLAINYPRKEVWVGIVEAGAVSQYLTKVLIWNWEENSIAIKDLPDLAFMAYGQVAAASATTFDAASGSFNAATGFFDSPGPSPANIQMILAKAYSSSQLLSADTGYTDRGTAYTSYLERTGLAIVGRDRQGNLQVDPTSVKFVRSVFPKISAPNGTVLQISIGMQENLGGAVTWDGPHNFTVGTDVKIDTAISGKFLALRIADNSGSVPWEFSGYTLDMDVISRF